LRALPDEFVGGKVSRNLTPGSTFHDSFVWCTDRRLPAPLAPLGKLVELGERIHPSLGQALARLGLWISEVGLDAQHAFFMAFFAFLSFLLAFLAAVLFPAFFALLSFLFAFLSFFLAFSQADGEAISTARLSQPHRSGST
jgi:hypothetical protein